MALIYKIVSAALWRTARAAGRLDGMPVDLNDGYIHFSTAAQLRQTAQKHFAGQDDLVLLGVEADGLGPALRWEPSRGGALFPHLYGPLGVEAVGLVRPLPLEPDGSHRFPEDIP